MACAMSGLLLWRDILDVFLSLGMDHWHDPAGPESLSIERSPLLPRRRLEWTLGDPRSH